MFSATVQVEDQIHMFTATVQVEDQIHMFSATVQVQDQIHMFTATVLAKCHTKSSSEITMVFMWYVRFK